MIPMDPPLHIHRIFPFVSTVVLLCGFSEMQFVQGWEGLMRNDERRHCGVRVARLQQDVSLPVRPPGGGDAQDPRDRPTRTSKFHVQVSASVWAFCVVDTRAI